MLPKLFVSRHISENYVIIAAITFISVGILIRVYKGRDEPIRAIWLVSEECKCISLWLWWPVSKTTMFKFIPITFLESIVKARQSHQKAAKNIWKQKRDERLNFLLGRIDPNWCSRVKVNLTYPLTLTRDNCCHSMSIRVKRNFKDTKNFRRPPWGGLKPPMFIHLALAKEIFVDPRQGFMDPLSRGVEISV